MYKGRCNSTLQKGIFLISFLKCILEHEGSSYLPTLRYLVKEHAQIGKLLLVKHNNPSCSHLHYLVTITLGHCRTYIRMGLVLCAFNGSHGNIGSPVFTGLSTLNKTTNDKLVCESQQKYYQIVLLNLNKKHILNIIKMIMDACFFEL